MACGGGAFPELALAKANRLLSKAESQLDACRAAKSFDAFQVEWSQFLKDTGSFLNGLEGAARESPKAAQWYFAKMKRDRSDELVRYMHQARNVEEHDYVPVARNDIGGLIIGNPGQGLHFTELRLGPEFFSNPTAYLRTRAFDILTGEPASVRLSPSGPELIAVTDKRHNVTTKPPRQHLGQKISNPAPARVGALYLSYLRAALEEAAALA